MTKRKIGIMKLIPKTEKHWSGQTMHYAKCNVCGNEEGATDIKYLMVGKKCILCKMIEERKKTREKKK